MNYPKIIALYRLERNGMIYDYLKATTKKEARETIKNIICARSFRLYC